MSSSAATARAYTREDWLLGYTSLWEEFDYQIIDIEGTVPATLRGTLYRNGPALFERNGQSVQHPFDGDGMVCKFHFRPDGSVSFRSRYVKTEGFLAEQQAGSFLYRGVFGTLKPGGFLANMFDLKMKNIANTNIIRLGDKLYALWEGGHPHALDPETLATLGLDDLGGQLTPGVPFSAHPHVCPETGRLVTFSLETGAFGTKLSLQEFTPAGKMVSSHQHQVSGFAFVHDFALTKDWAVFFQAPMSINPLPYFLGLRGPAECLEFRREKKLRILLVPRDGSPLRVVETDPCFVFHHANAHPTQKGLAVYSIVYTDYPQIVGGSNFRQVEFEKYPISQLWRWDIDFSTGSVSKKVLIHRACEFPAVHPDKVGKEARYLYLGCAKNPSVNAPLQGLMAYDFSTGTEQFWFGTDREFVSEPVFVPYPNGMREEDGWLLMVVTDAATARSYLAVHEAAAIAAGPVAKLHLRHHLPNGLHGNFYPDTN